MVQSVQAGGDVGSQQAAGRGFGEQWFDPRCVLQVDLLGFPYSLDVGVNLRKKGVWAEGCGRISPGPAPSTRRTALPTAALGSLGMGRWAGGDWHVRCSPDVGAVGPGRS